MTLIGLGICRTVGGRTSTVLILGLRAVRTRLRRFEEETTPQDASISAIRPVARDDPFKIARNQSSLGKNPEDNHHV